MIAETWKRVWEIYQEARKLGRDERTAYIESVTSDAEIAREVISLLNADKDEPARTERPPSRQKGETVGHYELIELLGRGGMAEVYTARDCELGRTVALKFVLPDSIGERDALRRAIREARAVSALNHPNIVTVYDVIHEESEIVIAMELVEGRSLRKFCSSPLNLDRVIHFGRQVALALTAAHQKGIVHRDIKPENLIARDDGLVKVLDFGLAREVAGEPGAESHSTAALPAGTPRYMAPEQLRGERGTAASDVFSLGVVLYELATGRHPFDSRFTWETAHAIVSRDAAGPDSLNPAIPPGLASLILRMLAKDATQRPSAERVAETLGDPNLLQQARPRLRYRRPIAAAILMAVVVCGAVFLIVRRPATPRALSVTDLTSLTNENRVTAAVISPKGDRFVYAALDGMYLRSIQPGSEKALEAPLGFRCDRLAWLPDDSGVLASGSPGQGGKRGIWIISLSGSPPRLVREDAMDAAPSPDGRSIAFVTPGRSELWIARIDGTGERRITGGRPESYSAILWSPDNRRIGYQHRKSLSSIYEWVDVSSGKLTGSLSSSYPVDSADILADGRMFFLSQSRPKQLSGDLWTAEFDPHTGSLRRPARLLARLDNGFHSDISATATGDRLAVLQRISQPEVYVADLEYPGPRLNHLLRPTYDKKGGYPHAWTPDSQSVIFESNRARTWDLYEQVVGERSPKVLVNTHADEVLPQMCPDGKWILYLAFTPKAHILMRIPAKGGSPETVPAGGPLSNASNFRCGQPGRSRCVLKTTEGDQFVFRELDPKLGKGRELLRVPRISGEMEIHTDQEDWSVSSSGAQIAVTARDTKNAYILVFDLDRSNRSPQRVVAVKGHGQLITLAYAAGDKGWFATVPSSGGLQLLYVDQDGRSHVLHEDPVQTWGVPSPDGRRIAFVDHKPETNVVMLEHF